MSRNRNIVATLFVSFCFLFAISAIGFAVRERAATINETNHRICVQIEDFKAVIRVSVYDQLSLLSTLSYYLTHQADLNKQQEQLREELYTFRARHCP